ncbi:hypothetical protein PILCRDRAFT_814622 [Piloderma croceum F 1598]|uniref:F-box domain-containing protein n=1 Tax=Piloderma croceum (strain F 1598) TaxID=765440 RepID=A0A0C3BN55_PILCF|nr:hypothetical protein PILCRDRAFT_814622 [Piloderma croceum F 1598]
MSCLPLELIHEVVVNVPSTTDLRTLRQVNRTFNKIATPGAFRVLDVRLNNVQGLENIHNSDNLRHLVEEIDFKYSDKPSDDEELESVEDSDTRLVKVTTVVKEQDEDECWDSDESGNIWDDYEDESAEEEDSNGLDKEAVLEQMDSESDANLVEDGDSWGEDEDGDDDISESDAIDMGEAGLFGWPYDGQDMIHMRVLWPALFRLHKFTRLKTLRFSFHSSYCECRRLGGAQPSLHFLVQKAVLASIASDPYPAMVRNLSLTNVIGIEDDVYESPTFQTVISSLQSLSISTIAPEYETGCDFELRHWYNDFWRSTMPTRFLTPPESSLTSLSLGSDVIIGPIDNFNINYHFFPRLASLKLERFLFHWYPVTEFILQHNATLQKLELRNCEMYVPHTVGPPIPAHWSDVYKRLQIEMTKLEELVVVTSAWRGEFSGQIYSEMGGESEFCQVELATEEEEDAVALAELYAVVDLRRLSGLGQI